jgi:hypothetical protein
MSLKIANTFVTPQNVNLALSGSSSTTSLGSLGYTETLPDPVYPPPSIRLKSLTGTVTNTSFLAATSYPVLVQTTPTTTSTASLPVGSIITGVTVSNGTATTLNTGAPGLVVALSSDPTSYSGPNGYYVAQSTTQAGSAASIPAGASSQLNVLQGYVGGVSGGTSNNLFVSGVPDTANGTVTVTFYYV